ncbi:MAG TPA: cyclophilin-like fold protein [Thermodesulfobacteriota bacterium]|nr:cyclophilin-like fold protein [Thermodesulfobacteriota bacterium]
MERKIRIKAGGVEAEAVLNDSPTARKVWEALPMEARGNTWGDEIYFSIPVKTGLEDGAREVVQVGDLGYWPSGNAFCIFFGPTPMSRGNEVRAASSVNVIGKVSGDAKIFKKVAPGAKVTIEKAAKE